jgi:hypothetical protein
MWNWREVVGPHHVARQRDRLPRHTHVLQHPQCHHTERIRSAILMEEIAEVQNRRLYRSGWLFKKIMPNRSSLTWVWPGFDLGLTWGSVHPMSEWNLPSDPSQSVVCVAIHRGEWDWIEGGNPRSELRHKDLSARIYRPSFSENKPKTLVFYDWKWAFWACFCENWVYNFGHRIHLHNRPSNPTSGLW